MISAILSIIGLVILAIYSLAQSALLAFALYRRRIFINVTAHIAFIFTDIIAALLFGALACAIIQL